MKSRILSIIAFLLSIVAIAIKSIAVTVPHFVDVHLVDDFNANNEENRIASLGVFCSEYDATNPSLISDTLAVGIPALQRKMFALEFPLLFPIQTNFFPEVLPINKRNINSIADFVGEGDEPTVRAVEEAINDVGAVDFDNCEDFVVNVQDFTEQYFDLLQDELLPKLFAQLQNSLKTDAESTIFLPILDLFDLEGSNPQLTLTKIISLTIPEAVIDAVGESNLDSVELGCSQDSGELNGDIPMLGEAVDCIAAVYVTIGRQELNSSLLRLAETVGRIFQTGGADDCVSSGFSIKECIEANADSFHLQDTPFSGAAQFPSILNPCNGEDGVVSVVCNNSLKSSYLNGVTDVLLEVLDEHLLPDFVAEIELFLDSLTLYLDLVDEESFVSNDATFSDAFDLWLDIAEDDARIEDSQTFVQTFIPPCTSLSLFKLFQTKLGVELAETNCSTLEDYLTDVREILFVVENKLFVPVGGIETVYKNCFDQQRENNALQNTNCPGFAANFVMVSLLGESQEFVETCENEVEDRKKVAIAQYLAMASIGLEAFAVLLIGVSLTFSLGRVLFTYIAAILSALGSFTVIIGIFIVQSTPAFAEIDVAPDELQPVLYNGYVGLLLFVDGALLFLCAVLLAIAACIASNDHPDTEDKDVTPQKEVETEVKDDT